MKYSSHAQDNSHFITNVVIVVRSEPTTHFPIFELSQNNFKFFFMINEHFDQNLKSVGMEQNRSED